MGSNSSCTMGAVVLVAFVSACSTAPPYRTGGTAEPESPTLSPPTESQPGTADWRRVYRGLLGIPYKYGGASRSGFDCSGLVGYLYRAYDGRILPRNVRDLYRTGQHVKEASLKPGDLVFYNTTGTRVSHVGLYLGDRRFLHASASRGVIITPMDEEYYARRYSGARRVRIQATAPQ